MQLLFSYYSIKSVFVDFWDTVSNSLGKKSFPIVHPMLFGLCISLFGLQIVFLVDFILAFTVHYLFFTRAHGATYLCTSMR